MTPRWAIGNLNGTFGYPDRTWGAAFGDPAATNLTIDATHGLRIRHGTTDQLVADTSGNLWLAGNLTIATTGTFRTGATSFTTGNGIWMDAQGGGRLRLGTPTMSTSGTAHFSFDNATGTINLYEADLFSQDRLHRRLQHQTVSISTSVNRLVRAHIWPGGLTISAATTAVLSGEQSAVGLYTILDVRGTVLPRYSGRPSMRDTAGLDRYLAANPDRCVLVSAEARSGAL